MISPECACGIHVRTCMLYTELEAQAQAQALSCSSLPLQLFRTDIEYLLSMEKLWENRTPPTPLSLHHLPSPSENDGRLLHVHVGFLLSLLPLAHACIYFFFL